MHVITGLCEASYIYIARADNILKVSNNSALFRSGYGLNGFMHFSPATIPQKSRSPHFTIQSVPVFHFFHFKKKYS